MRKAAFRVRTYVSLYVNCIIFLMVLMGSIWMMSDKIPSSHAEFSALGIGALKLFTVDSNIFTGLVSVLLIGRSVLTLMGRKVKPSKIVSILNLASVTGVTITFLTVLCFLAPNARDGFKSLYLESNLFFHLFVPVLSLIDFVFLSSNEKLGRPWCVTGFVPFIVYGLFYCIPLLINAAADGTIANGYDWYGFFGGNTANMLRMLTVLCGAALLVSILLWRLMNLHRENLDRHGPGTDYNVVSASLEESVAAASEYYVTNVIRIICLIAPIIGMCAGGIFTALWLTGNFTFKFAEIFIFDCICMSYLIVALFLFNTCIGSNGIAIASKVTFGKVVLTCLLLLQWNLISYIAPFREFWAYCFLFVLLSALFLDSRMVLVNIIAHLTSIVISCIIMGDELLPPRGPAFVSNIVLRISLLALGCFLIYLMILLIEKTLLKTLDKFSDFDALTHALNRRKLNLKLSDAIEDFTARGEDFCVAISDLDDFKIINDTYGHTSGDEVLIEFVRIMNSAVTSRDYVFRYGGEEFLVIFKSDLNSAYSACASFNRALMKTQFGFMPEGRHMTVTVGVAQYAAGMSTQEIIKLADERLYIGKQQGKNRVVIKGGGGVPCMN